jgi:hypothetical protein
VDEAAGDLEEDRHDREVRHAPEDGRHHLAGHAVAGVHRDLERALQVQELQHVLAVRAPQVHLLVGALQPRLPDPQRGGDALDVVQPARRTDRLGLGAADLEAVVVDRIVRRGRHDAADRVEVVDGEVDERRVHHADVDDVHAGGAQAFGE